MTEFDAVIRTANDILADGDGTGASAAVNIATFDSLASPLRLKASAPLLPETRIVDP
jgi:mevalonate kinase